jgi:hypothetical protein
MSRHRIPFPVLFILTGKRVARRIDAQTSSDADAQSYRRTDRQIFHLYYPTALSVAQATSMAQNSPSVSRKKTSPGKEVPTAAPSARPSRFDAPLRIKRCLVFQYLQVNVSGSPADSEDQPGGSPELAVESAQMRSDVSPFSQVINELFHCFNHFGALTPPNP